MNPLDDHELLRAYQADQVRDGRAHPLATSRGDCLIETADEAASTFVFEVGQPHYLRSEKEQ